MNKIYTDLSAEGLPKDEPEEVIEDSKPEPVRKPKPDSTGMNKILLGLIVVILIGVVTYIIIRYNKKDNG